MKEEQDRNEKTLMHLKRRIAHPDRYFLIKIKYIKNIISSIKFK